MICRLYKFTDKTEIIKIIDLVCAECEWMSTTSFIPTLQWDHALLRQDCTRHALFVADEEGKIAGWCRLFPEKCFLNENYWELGIGLLPEYRNRKIGHELLETVIVWAHNQNAQQINLTTNGNNQIAFHLFNKVGFRITNKQDSILSMSLLI